LAGRGWPAVTSRATSASRRVEDLAAALAAGELDGAPATRAVVTELLAGVAAPTA